MAVFAIKLQLIHFIQHILTALCVYYRKTYIIVVPFYTHGGIYLTMYSLVPLVYLTEPIKYLFSLLFNIFSLMALFVN